jgi:hypothetical protein
MFAIWVHCHDLAEILLKVALNTITLNITNSLQSSYFYVLIGFSSLIRYGKLLIFE